MNLFDLTSFECSKVVTQHYSTSFTLGIKTLHKKFHFPVYAIYGFARLADEIVDTFHAFDKEKLLRDFRNDTFQAIEQGISLNPILHAFQMTVRQYDIERKLIDAFLGSMEMDIHQQTYNKTKYQEYIYGSAEVVGLMCLKVFCEGNPSLYDELRIQARSLGAAFQKVNFLRDINSDYYERGRLYFPDIDFRHFTEEGKLQIEEEIQKDFDNAQKGIQKLPTSARSGVYLAYTYYLKLFKKIKNCSPARITTERIRIPNTRKFALLIGTYFQHRFNY